MKLREKKLINSKERAGLTASRFVALETESNSPRNEYRMKTIYENKPRVINNDQKEKMKYTGQVCSTTEEPQEELNPLNANLNPTCHLLALLGAHHILHVSRIRVNLKPKVEPNLQNHSLTPISNQT
jgi:hypothetical protein